MAISTSEIQLAANEQRLLKIAYNDAKNQQTVRTVEPYEIKDGKLFAYCTQAQNIRAFKLERIFSTKAMDLTFEPRFPIKIALGASNG